MKIPESGVLKLASDPVAKESSDRKRNSHNQTEYMARTVEKFNMGGGEKAANQEKEELVETIQA